MPAPQRPPAAVADRGRPAGRTERPSTRSSSASRPTTDCFVFCHGWLNDLAEARDGAERFFGHLDAALRAARRPRRPAPRRDPLAVEAVRRHRCGTSRRAGGARPPGARRVRRAGASCTQAFSRGSDSRRCARREVPLGPEEELELDALLRLAREGARRGGVTPAPAPRAHLLAHEAAGGPGGRAAWPRAAGAGVHHARRRGRHAFT